MPRIDRRGFLQAAGAAGATLALSPQSYAKTSANGQIGVGLIGAGGRGAALISGFHHMPDTNVVAVADPDPKRSSTVAEKYGAKGVYTDLRQLLDDPAVDAVVVATCNHWHCLAAIWAMQAGKDVYVEKPLSHSQWEGKQVVKAARKYNRVCQLGTQQRSDPLQAEVRSFLHQDAELGRIQYVQANRFGVRGSIGKRTSPLTVDKNVDYDLWLGPAQDQPLYRNQLHYDWHWDWNTGSGEMGNWGVHVLDDVRNVVFQDSVSTPTRVMSAGGRVVWDDAGNTPNVHYTYLDTGEIPTLIALSNLPAAPGAKPGWSSQANRKVKGPSSGYVVVCEGGYYLGWRGGGKAFDSDGNMIREFRGGSMDSLHKRNFVDAIHSRDHMSLNAEIEIGHHSTGWCNLANVSYRIGEAVNTDSASQADVNMEAWPLVLEEMKSQLAKFGVSPSDASITTSPLLSHDPQAEQFVGEHASLSNQFLKREYRGNFTVPEEV